MSLSSGCESRHSPPAKSVRRRVRKMQDPQGHSIKYQVYTFVGTGEIAVLPISWVKYGQVKYDSKKANDYIKSNREPYKKWTTYKVTPVCDKIFDNYANAFKAEKILADKSDLDSTDMEMLRDDGILSRKRRRKAPLLEDFKYYEKHQKSISDHGPSSDGGDSCSESDQEIISDPPDLLVENNADLLLDSDNQVRSNDIENYVNEKEDPRHSSHQQSSKKSVEFIDDVIDDGTLVTLATSKDIESLKMAVELHNTKLDELIKKSEELINLFKNKGRGLTHRDIVKENEGLSFDVPGLQLPLRSKEEIGTLEKELEKDDILTKFTNFLNRLGGDTLRATVKIIIQKMYSLQLQQKINYTGREKKIKIGGLRQVKVILEVMQRNSGETEVKAIDELMYHLQHVSDRIRSARKTEGAQ